MSWASDLARAVKRRVLERLESYRSGLRERRTSRELRELEARAQRASPSYQPHYLARAAEVAAAADRREEALTYFGRAVDGYIEAARARAAEVLCRKILSQYPDVVRARRTLALLALGRGDHEAADRLIHEYAEAARKQGDTEILTASLRTMAGIAQAGPVLERAAEELRAAGDPRGAERVLKRTVSPDEESAGHHSDHWSDAIRAALLGPAEITSRAKRPL